MVETGLGENEGRGGKGSGHLEIQADPQVADPDQ
jgi:hypothetical protein